MIAIDSSVLVDLLANGPQAESAEACLRQSLSAGPVVVCEVVLAEVCTALRDGSEAMAVLDLARALPELAGVPHRILFSTRCFRQRGATITEAAA